MVSASYKKYFISAIAINFPDRASGLIAKVDNHFIEISEDIRFASTSENPIDKRLDFSAYFLALIEVVRNYFQEKRIPSEMRG